MKPPIVIELSLWRELVTELKRRGRAERESGAFLLGPAGGDMITRFICYDDLDPQALQGGIISFSSSGFIPLWKICADHQLKVLADVHTHPGDWTGQSQVDRENPMIVQQGHLALIVPAYAQRPGQLLDGVGAYEYLGSKQWKTFTMAADILHFKPKKTHGIFRKFLQSLVDWLDRKKWFRRRGSVATVEKF